MTIQIGLYFMAAGARKMEMVPGAQSPSEGSLTEREEEEKEKEEEEEEKEEEEAIECRE